VSSAVQSLRLPAPGRGPTRRGRFRPCTHLGIDGKPDRLHAPLEGNTMNRTHRARETRKFAPGHAGAPGPAGGRAGAGLHRHRRPRGWHRRRAGDQQSGPGRGRVEPRQWGPAPLSVPQRRDDRSRAPGGRADHRRRGRRLRDQRLRHGGRLLLDGCGHLRGLHLVERRDDGDRLGRHLRGRRRRHQLGRCRGRLQRRWRHVRPGRLDLRGGCDRVDRSAGRDFEPLPDSHQRCRGGRLHRNACGHQHARVHDVGGRDCRPAPARRRQGLRAVGHQ
jgi:hypothetical protein